MRALSLFCALLCASLPISAQEMLSTPLQPVRIVSTGNAVHVLCARTDLNFNGNLDNGDIPASWLTIDADSRQVIRRMEFAWGNVTAQRFGVSRATSTFDIGVDNLVQRFTITDQRSVDLAVTVENMSSVSSSPDGTTIWVAQRPNFTDPGSVVELDIAGQDRTSFKTGPNPQAPLPYEVAGVSGLAVLCEGTFGGGNGTLELRPSSGTPTTIGIGDTPNHLLIHGERAYVTVNGSHSVVVVDLSRKEAIDTILVGTSGYDGPREAAIDTSSSDGIDRLFVSTFSSDVRVFNLSTGARIATLNPGAKPEGLAVVGNELWVTRTFVAGGYAVTSDIAIFPINAATSVSEERSSSAPSAIVAISGHAQLPFAIDENATITDLTGKTTRVSAVVSDAQTLDCRHLTSGVYALRSGQHSVTVIR